MPHLLAADKDGRIFSLPRLTGAGMEAGHFFRLDAHDLIRLPSGSQVFMLPDRRPAGYDPKTENFVIKDGCFAVGAFITPGFTVTSSSAYRESGRPRMLPLFSYAACALYKDEVYVAALRIDKELRHDPRFIDINKVRRGVEKIRKMFSRNRLIRRLADCALKHGCPGAQNFFLSRYEGPLPTSPSCNAGCFGCISYQPSGSCPPTQPRIKFAPAPEEVAEAALFHIYNVRDPVISFGQGCEGEPLLAADIVEKSITLIRKNTSRGVINMNTNASRPNTIGRLFYAGLDSVRVSLNSARERYYAAYYRPKDYKFKDVVRSIKIAKSKGGFVSINYLTMPGFTDSVDEFSALKDFIRKNRVDMIQWRNLNFDPLRYFRILKFSCSRYGMLGVRQIIYSLRKSFPRLMMGYYNPSRGRMRRFNG